MKTIDVDVAVIGGGAIGAACTYFIQKRGMQVALIERREIAVGASGANAAFVWTTTRKPGIQLSMALASVQLYQALAGELGRDIEYRRGGGLMVFRTREELESMRPWVAARQEQGLSEMRIVDRDELLEICPYLSPEVVGATFNPLDGVVNPFHVCTAFIDRATESGAVLFEHTLVEDIVVRKGRVYSVSTSQGEIRTRYVVNACGAWAPEIGALVGVKIPNRS